MAFALTDQCTSGSYGLSICVPRWRALFGAPFNEIGDALAGFAGALAFVWLIVTVLIQGRELAAQREELEATRRVQQEQLEAMKAQADVFRDEQTERQQERTRRTVVRLLQGLTSVELIREGYYCSWSHSPTGGDYDETTYAQTPKLPAKADCVEGDEYLARAVETFCSNSVRLSEILVGDGLPANCSKRPAQTLGHEMVASILGAVWSRVDRLSEADKIWVQNMNIERAKYAWEDLLAFDPLWSNPQ